MNIDANVQKILFALLRRWKLLVVFALIGVLLGYIYTSNFTTPTYTSNVLFLAYAVDGNDDVSSASSSNDVARVSNTSKMNYAMKMLDTYVEIMKTNAFYTEVADELNRNDSSNYSSSTISGSMEIESIENTAMFKITVTTTDPELSYKIATQLKTSVPRMMKRTNNGLVAASVEDEPVKASSHVSLGYPKKCAIGGVAGILLAGAYVVLRTLFDVRIKSSDELTDKYNIPVLGTIPSFESKGVQTLSRTTKKGDEE